MTNCPGVDSFVAPGEQEALRVAIGLLQWHSLKVTMVDAAVHKGEDSVIVSMQAHHANTDLVEKCTRSRSALPMKMVSRVLEDFRSKWKPADPIALAAPLEADEFSDEEPIGEPAVFYVKQTSVLATERRILLQKFHVTDAADGTKLACNKFALAACVPVGPDVPDPELMCKVCKLNRPDLFV